MHDQQHESSPFARQNGWSKLLQASLSCTPASRLCGVAAWHTLNLSRPSTVHGQPANCGGELRWWLLEACTDAMLRGVIVWRAAGRDGDDSASERHDSRQLFVIIHTCSDFGAGGVVSK